MIAVQRFATSDEERNSAGMSSEGHQLHQVQFEGAVEPAGAFAIESRPAPDGVTLMALSGELDIAATSELRACVDRAA